MRFAIVLSLAAGLAVGCASKNKNEPAATAATTAQATADKAKADAKGAVKDAKAAVKEAKKATKEAAASAQATAKEAVAGATKVECKNKGETRSLEVRAKDKGCEVAYTKAGQENVVGSSMNGTAHCDGIMTKIKDKLVTAGYTCN